MLFKTASLLFKMLFKMLFKTLKASRGKRRGAKKRRGTNSKEIIRALRACMDESAFQFTKSDDHFLEGRRKLRHFGPTKTHTC